MPHFDRSTRWPTTALACMLFAAALPLAARGVAGPPGADVHVEWKPSVDAETRARLETELRLANPRKLADVSTWRYDLTDPSSDNIEALVTHPAVEDTHEIDRNTFTLEPTAPRTLRRQRFDTGGDALVGTADALSVVLIAAAVIAATRRSPIAFIQRAIPELDARAAGLFRLAFGTAVLAFFASRPVDSSWLGVTFDLEVDGQLHRFVIDWLRLHPAIVNGLTPWILITGAAFTIGLFTRVTYALFVAGALLWAYVAMSVSSTHPYASFVLTLVALLPSRWGDALSVDAWRRRRGGERTELAPARVYGYSVWIPGLVFGLAFAAAAWAKLTVPPGLTDWVLNGTVKYHFITDSVSAPVDWGLELAKHPRMAVAASFAAIAIEALVITAAFVRSQWYRLAMGAGAVGLLAGFYLFMGVFWPGWWIQLLGFLPWQALGGIFFAPRHADSLTAARSFRMATVAQTALIVFVITQQAVVSSLRLERAPMFSWYDMYSGTYSDPQAWAKTRPPRYRIVASTAQGPVEVLQCNGQPPYGEFVRRFELAVKGSREARTSVWRELQGCGEPLTHATAVTLEGDVRVFNWDTLKFTTTPKAVTLGPLSAERDQRADTP